MSRWTTEPITDRQATYIRRLSEERNLNLSDAELQRMTKADASQAITNLLRIPKAAPKPTEYDMSQYPSPPNPPLFQDGLDLSNLQSGRYAARVNGVVKFFRISTVSEGPWAGWAFVRLQAGDDVYKQGSQQPGRLYRGRSIDYLEVILQDPAAALLLYGKELGVCGVCGRTLTDEDSRARGIGPVCAERLGMI